MVPIFKDKEDIQDCRNYRSINFMIYSMKNSEKIIDKRLKSKISVTKNQLKNKYKEMLFADDVLVGKNREVNQKLDACKVESY